MTKNQEIQRLYRIYKEETGNTEVDMRDFAKWMNAKGWKLPTPPDPWDLFAKQLTEAIREEIRQDSTTGKPYKPNISFAIEKPGQGTLWKWVDVDEAKRPVVVKCLVNRREQTVNDIYQIELIQDHWNNTHPNEEPIKMPLDYQPDMDWKKNGPDQSAA